MPRTREFTNLLRRNERKFGKELAIVESMREARELDIDIFQPRKQHERRFKKQKGNFDFPDIF